MQPDRALLGAGFVAFNAFVSGVYFTQLVSGGANERTPYAFVIHSLWMIASVLILWRDSQRVTKDG